MLDNKTDYSQVYILSRAKTVVFVSGSFVCIQNHVHFNLKSQEQKFFQLIHTTCQICYHVFDVIWSTLLQPPLLQPEQLSNQLTVAQTIQCTGLCDLCCKPLNLDQTDITYLFLQIRKIHGKVPAIVAVGLQWNPALWTFLKCRHPLQCRHCTRFRKYLTYIKQPLK